MNHPSESRTPQQGRKKLSKAWVLAIGLLLTMFLLETGTRILTRVDDDGNVTIRSRRLKPYSAPVTRIRERVEAFTQGQAHCVDYHPDLGWAPRPGGHSENGLYDYDEHGIRIGKDPRKIDKTPPEGVTRIALFGDSFTHGDDVAFHETWGAQLEAALREKGLNVEVLNFGFGGYGIDQAFLRWRLIGRQYAPHVVVLGFQAENALRNVNMIRPLYYWKTGLPFSKPRFIDEGGNLSVINSPAVRPEKLPELLSNLFEWEHRDHEFFLEQDDYERSVLNNSRFVTIVQDILKRGGKEEAWTQKASYTPKSEAGSITLRIIETFAKEAREQQASFWVAHLPKRQDLHVKKDGGALIYGELIATLVENHQVADATDAFLEEVARGAIDSLFVSPTNGHYSGQGNAIVARVLAEKIGGS